MNNIWRKLIIISTVLLATQGCKNIAPIYSKNSDSYKFLSQIEITSINSIEGANLYNNLKNILPYGENKKYLLSIAIKSNAGFSIFLQNSDVHRQTIIMNVDYTLQNINTNKTVTKGSFSRLSSYSTAFSPYNNQNSKQYSINKLAGSSAEEIRNRLIMFHSVNKHHEAL